MCFMQQRGAIFRHPRFQEWPDAGVFCTFWLENVLRAAVACNFSFLIWPGGSAPAALASPLFDPPDPQIIGKNAMFRDFPNISRTCIFLLLTLSLSLSSTLLFYSSLLCFSSLHIVGSLTSKLPLLYMHIHKCTYVQKNHETSIHAKVGIYTYLNIYIYAVYLYIYLCIYIYIYAVILQCCSAVYIHISSTPPIFDPSCPSTVTRRQQAMPGPGVMPCQQAPRLSWDTPE